MYRILVVLLCVVSAWSLPPSSVQIGDLVVPFDYNLDNPLKHLEVHPIIKARLNQKIDGRIINGLPARPGDAPWQAALFIAVSGGTTHCSAAIISSQWGLSVAHCVQGTTAITLFIGTIYLNATDSNTVIVSATAVISHPGFNGQNLANDIVLLRLSDELTFNDFVRPIPLHPEVIPSIVEVTVCGWGTTDDASNELSNELYCTILLTISNEVCQITYGNIVQNGTLCLRGASDQAPCRGDSGAPVVNAGELVGLVSFSSAQGCAVGAPTGTTRISEYREWINGVSGIQKLNFVRQSKN